MARGRVRPAALLFSGGVLVMNACGGRVLTTSPADDASALSSADVTDAPSLDAPIGKDTTPLQVPSAAADARSSGPPPSSFPVACTSFAALVGKTSCEACVSQANRQCDREWSELQQQCPVAYACGIQCVCTAPCSSADVCGCITGCLPLHDDPCTRLWTAAMSCVGSACSCSGR